MIHELKCWPESFELIRLGIKRFEIRRDDRHPAFAGGDVLWLREWDPDATPRGWTASAQIAHRYTGREMRVHVTHIASQMRDGAPRAVLDGIGGFAVMSIVVIEEGIGVIEEGVQYRGNSP